MADRQNPAIPASLYGAVDLSGLADRAQRAAGQGAGQGAASVPAPDGDDPRGAAAQAAASGQAPVATLPDAVVDGDERVLQQFMQLSQFLPVLVEMHAGWSSDAKALSPVLAQIVRSLDGRTVLVRIDLDAHPTLGQQPQVLAILGGRPLQLFAGNPPAEQLRGVIGELLQLAAEQGLAGRVQIEGAGDDAAAGQAAQPAEPELPPLHREAFDAAERGDYAAGIAAFDRALAENPADDDARAGRAQLRLLERLHGRTLDEIRAAAAERPADLDAQIAVADLDISGGHVEDAFDRLLTLFPKSAPEERTRVREHLLELFLIVGNDDPRVGAARRRLTNLLF